MAERSASDREIPRRRFLRGASGLTAASVMAAATGVKPASAETPIPKKEPTPNPLDVDIEKAKEELAQLQRDRPKREILEGIRAQIKAELTSQKTPPTPDSRDAQITVLQKQLAETQKQFEDFRRTLSSDPTVKVFTDEQLKQYVKSGVEIQLRAKEAEEAAQKVAEAARKAQDVQRIAADKEEAQRIRVAAAEDSNSLLDRAKAQAAAMKGKVELPLVGEIPDKAAMAGAGLVGGLLGRWVVRPIKWTREATGLIRRLRGHHPPGGRPTP